MGRYFGTDGVRGLANVDVTAELALDLSVAAAHVLGDAGVFSGHRPRAVVGRDPRASGEFLSAAVVAGLASAGVDVSDVGVLPTPGIAHVVTATGADLGVVLSASHNPMPDNGIKFFARGGHKLPDEVEDAIEARLREPWARPTGADVGRVTSDVGAGGQYVEHLLSTLPHRLDGLRVVVDCAHGAAWSVGPEALRRAGADVVVIGASPDGLNTNDGVGSTHLEPLQRAVLEHGADAGIAFDGDADRCLAVDATGAVVDGDQIMGVLALALASRGQLPGSVLVATVMSNLGLLLAMRAAGVEVVQTAVGDRYVLEAMREHGYVLGGEQSGHVVMLDHQTTGDGVLTALHLLARVAELGQPLAEVASVVQRLPQVLVNVPRVDKARASTDPHVAAAVAEASAELGDTGRVLLRPSGTEPLVRVMVEAAEETQARAVADRLAAVVQEHLAL
ncbi:phosphoglucosamine mutase [Quadrisphaera granulorum]|uniref:Phosphoglucosamine mutase n=1 Tax=Quadrisphaera granulorum TaxID=317664 RepID=A0A316ACS5_9ACTN|nr:phosphoglucosamine mutase [Quadrisphaera granulorum]PWJ55441.1 phosphoglucosamine mutase [Quadrisphaera granulorum]SZE95505.1 phosphoglucosamine mutase [Quadrisphaera granulorum]